MQFVYATGQPRNMEFAITSQQHHIPTGATIYATLCGSKAVENLDEHTFNSMSDEEFYAYRALLQNAREQQQQGAQDAPKGLNKIFGWLGLR